ncbi:MAG: response regulator [Candidatus Thioglobus sp.]|nr:response regulator [Candidatus Thioglobus sp.]MBT7912748.1 response regulator [Candidatus Bathyarchaeota archaeon]
MSSQVLIEAIDVAKRVLLIEDRQSYADEVCELLTNSDIGLVHVDNLDDADVKELLLQDWMCVLLDLDVPPYDGRATVNRAKSLTSNTIVVLTGYDKDGMDVSIIKTGADDYLLKHSVTREHLISAIRISAARHLRRIGEDESARQLKAQMQVLTQLADLMSSIKDLLTPSRPWWKDFFNRLLNPDERRVMAAQLKGTGWFIGRILFEIAAIVAALRFFAGEL